MLEGFRRHHASKKEARRIMEAARNMLGIDIPRRSSVEHAVGRDAELILVDGTPIFMVLGDRLIPTLHFLVTRREAVSSMPRVIVDEGAVGPVSRGADVMAPGIVRIEGDFDKGALVVVLEPKHGIPIAVAEALHSSEEIRSMEKGRTLRNIHHVGDKVWKAAPPRRIG